MDIEKCRALLCMIQIGSLTAAGQALGYTPSGISRMVASLEDECGFSLLIRGRNGAFATKECEKLLPGIINMVDAQESLLSDIDRILGIETGHIEVGSAYSYYYGWLAKTIAEFGKIYPKITIGVTEGTSSELMKMAEDSKLDMAIASRREKGMRRIPLKKDRIIAWVPRDHPAVQLGKLPLKALETEPFIEMYPGVETDNSRMFAKNNIKVNARFSATDNLAAYSMVSEGLGITTVNEIFAKMWQGDGVAVLPLDPPQMVDIGIALPRIENSSPALKKFVEFIEQRLPEYPLTTR